MGWDFDQMIERRHTMSIKYDLAAFGKAEDVLPLWVADMDFPAPPCVAEALAERSRHGIFGYSEAGAPYFAALKSWFAGKHAWNIEPDWLVKTPGIVNAIHIALLALTEPDDAVIIQPPVYHPFAAAIHQTGRQLVINQLIYEDHRYRIDFDDFEQKISQHQVKLFILCNPHNPVGRVWTREELTRLGEICLHHGVVVVADEIHQDFVYEGRRHLVFAGLDPAYADITVTCTAPSKTFNLGGLPLSNIFIANARLRESFTRECARLVQGPVGVMEIVACQAAYQGGEQWLAELLRYLAANMALIEEFLKQRLPEIQLVKPEGTYLAWLDFRALGLDARELDTLLTQRARLWLNPGEMFGAGGGGFARLNAACPRAVLIEAMERLERAVRD